eukprot:CAMPEP_0113727940 /NCGR_PEP_ID=MMETSP0038_2-20120614/41536_1 /TAXON_ID=2898 /ORGANISM="Cryptomonas paramecium" /LENGTH=234 /DNA_ID=CAMNT_0000659253 /DNA_START=807 /DNA_END=1508 /DNA_ORIENTATION=- /assembly_acc=CAM_ASM_000170
MTTWGQLGPDLLRLVWTLAHVTSRSQHGLLPSASHPSPHLSESLADDCFDVAQHRGRLFHDYKLRLLHHLGEAVSERIIGHTISQQASPRFTSWQRSQYQAYLQLQAPLLLPTTSHPPSFAEVCLLPPPPYRPQAPFPFPPPSPDVAAMFQRRPQDVPVTATTSAPPPPSPLPPDTTEVPSDSLTDRGWYREEEHLLRTTTSSLQSPAGGFSGASPCPHPHPTGAPFLPPLPSP